MAVGMIVVVLLLMTGVIEFAALHWTMRMLDPYAHASAFVLSECVVAVVVPLMLLVAMLRALRRSRGLDAGQALLLGILVLLLLVFGVSLSMPGDFTHVPAGPFPAARGRAHVGSGSDRCGPTGMGVETVYKPLAPDGACRQPEG